MSVRIKAMLGLTAAAMSASTLFPMSAQAATAFPNISTVDCGSDPVDAGYTIFIPDTSAAWTCIANAGDLAINIPNVLDVYSGNNVVQFNYEYNGRYYTYGPMPKDQWVEPQSGNLVDVYEVRVS